MIELLLKFILCFLFGFGIGFMILDFISSKREKKLKLEKEELISENEKLNGDNNYLKKKLDIYKYYYAVDIREFKIIENFDSFDIILRLVRINPYCDDDVLIKRFYFKNDMEYAKLCAQELLDELNNTN
jgi:hypothetical protein